MASVVFKHGDVELQELESDTFAIVGRGDLTITAGGGTTPLVTVAGRALAWLPGARNGPFKRVDVHTYIFPTADLMSMYYVTLPKGADAAALSHFEAVLEALAAGQPAPAAPAGAPAQADASAPAGASQGGGGNVFQAVGGLMGAVVQKAGEDTLKVAQAIADKAKHDISTLQQNGQPKPA